MWTSSSLLKRTRLCGANAERRDSNADEGAADGLDVMIGASRGGDATLGGSLIEGTEAMMGGRTRSAELGAASSG